MEHSKQCCQEQGSETVIRRRTHYFHIAWDFGVRTEIDNKMPDPLKMFFGIILLLIKLGVAVFDLSLLLSVYRFWNPLKWWSKQYLNNEWWKILMLFIHIYVEIVHLNGDFFSLSFFARYFYIFRRKKWLMIVVWWFDYVTKLLTLFCIGNMFTS